MSMIEICREFKKRGLDAHVILGVHDEVIGLAHEDCLDEAKEIIKDKMQNNLYTRQIPVPMIAHPISGDNLSECKWSRNKMKYTYYLDWGIMLTTNGYIMDQISLKQRKFGKTKANMMKY